MHVYCLANQTHFNMKCRAPGLVFETEEKATQKWLIEFFFFSFFLLQCAKRATRRARLPIVHWTVVRATCVTRFRSQQQNLKINQQVKPLNWLQASEPFCLFLS